MTVETNARFLSELNEAYPRNRDLIKEGDDHIRLVKNVLKNTFPAIDRAVNYSAENLNKMNSTFVYDGDTLGVTSSLAFDGGLTLDMGGNVLKEIGEPEEANDAVNLGYLQGEKGAWPVGSIFFTVDSRNPNEIMGFGVWEEFAAGRVIIGTGSGTDANNETKLFANEGTGGEYAHKLTAETLPSHQHGLGDIAVAEAGNHSHQYGLGRAYDESGTGRPQIGGGQSKQMWAVGYNTNIHNGGIGYDGTHTHPLSGSMEAIGGGQAHNNIQPYICVNIWKRTE